MKWLLAALLAVSVYLNVQTAKLAIVEFALGTCGVNNGTRVPAAPYRDWCAEFARQELAKATIKDAVFLIAFSATPGIHETLIKGWHAEQPR